MPQTSDRLRALLDAGIALSSELSLDAAEDGHSVAEVRPDLDAGYGDRAVHEEEGTTECGTLCFFLSQPICVRALGTRRENVQEKCHWV